MSNIHTVRVISGVWSELKVTEVELYAAIRYIYKVRKVGVCVYHNMMAIYSNVAGTALNMKDYAALFVREPLSLMGTDLLDHAGLAALVEPDLQ